MSHKIDICKYLNICTVVDILLFTLHPLFLGYQVFSATHLCVIASRDTAGLLGVKLAPVSLGLARGELSLMRSGL